MEQDNEQRFENELQEIGKAIEARRGDLEREYGMTQEGSVERHVLSEKIIAIKGELAKEAVDAPLEQSNSPESSYVDTLDPKSTQEVNALVENMREKGLKQAIADARNNIPYFLDAFHDILVDRLYDELKEKGYI